MNALQFWNGFSSAGRIEPAQVKEDDIPAEWRTSGVGAVDIELTDEESEAIELDRR